MIKAIIAEYIGNIVILRLWWMCFYALWVALTLQEKQVAHHYQVGVEFISPSNLIKDSLN